MVTDELRGFLANIDTAFLATASADGDPYVQHRGGPRGFIRAVDDETLGFVNVVGNRQYLSAQNLEQNDRVCLFLIDYARRARVKVWGRARLVSPEDAAAHALDAGARTPGRADFVMLITVERWDVNCPKGIPQKVDAAEVALVIEQLRARVAQLEAELARATSG
jgi:hypothetical protein